MDEIDCLGIVLENLDKYTTDGLKELIDMTKDEIKKRKEYIKRRYGNEA